ncbi:acyclic terpene utilization AtuA family protein, partial [Micromonospora sp. STR1s_5]|nr:acyclic terpene utilization AtuA family protein [Micromonospora sp. STR1s_5]
MRAVLPACRARRTRIVTNMGAANPRAAAEKIRDVARELGLSGLRIAAVLGDDVLDVVRGSDLPIEETGGRIADLGNSIVSANAYLGAGRSRRRWRRERMWS